ncbi:phasin family protein [Bradyrhizobium sp. TZ2]
MSAVDPADRQHRISKCHHASAAQPTQTWRSLALWFDIGTGEKNVGYGPQQTAREIRTAQPEGERSKKPASQQSPAPVQLQSPDQDQPLQPVPDHAESPEVVQQQPAVAEQIDAAATPPEAPPTAAPAPTAALEPPPMAAPSPAEAAPVSLQTIANAYRDYTRKSFEEFGSFVEQLSGARSLDKAVTVQTEFVKRAYETSVAESQKICELHSKLARQTLQPFQGLVGKAPATHGKS